MAINPKTGLEDPNYKPTQTTDIRGNVDTSMPVGAKSLSANITPMNANIGGTAPVSAVQKDAFNTPQVEVVGGGPKVNLDVMNQYRKDLGTGPALEHTATPQPADSTISNVSGGFSNLKPVTPVGTPPVGTGITPTPSAEAVDTTKLSPEELAYYNAQKTRIDAIGAKKGMEAAIKDMQAELKLDKEKKFATDVEEAMQFAKNQAERQMEIFKIQNERDIKDASDKLAKQVENAQRFKGAAGFPQTQAALKAQQGNIDRTRQVIGEMQTISQLVNEGNAERLAKQMNELQDQLDLNVSKAVQETMTNLQTLITSGKLDSVEAIVKAKTDLLDGLNSKYNDFLNNTYEASATLLKNAETRLKDYRDSQKYNDDFTKQMGDGFMYNVNGQKMTDASGNPLRAISTAGKPLSTTPITLNDGSLAMIYQNPDGTVRTEKLEGTKPVQLTPQALVKYSDLVSRGAISVDDLRQLGFSREDINSIVSQVTPETTTKLKNVTIKDAEGNEIPASYNETTGEYTVGGQVYSGEQIKGSGGTVTSGTDLRSAAKKYPNEASLKNNNPAGITFNNNFAQTLTNAGIQFTKGTARPSAEGGNYFSFPNIEEGFKAYDLLWNSPSYTNLTVGKALQRWGTGSLPGVDTTKKVGDLTQSEKEQLQIAQLRKESPGMYKELVANGMIGSEGFNIQEVPQQVGGEKQAREYTATDAALFNKFLSGKDTEADTKTLKRLGYTRADIDSYAASKPKTSELTDDQRVIYNSQLNSFRGNQVIKDYESQIGQVSNIVSSLGANSGPGDIAAVFSFMKALDPSSVVREGEFALAAKSSGVVGSFQNMLSKLENGEMLTSEQKKQFGDLSKKYLENKSSQYDRLYDDMARVTKLSGIPEDYLPKRASEQVKEKQPQPVTTGRWQQSQGVSGAGTTAPTQGRWQQSNPK